MINDRPEFFSHIKSSNPNVIIDKFEDMMVLYDFAIESEIYSIQSNDIIYEITFKDSDNLQKFIDIISSCNISYRFFKSFIIDIINTNVKKNIIKLKINSSEMEIGL